MRDFAVFGSSHVEGSRLAPLPFDTHVFCTLVRFSLLPPLVCCHGFFLSFCFCGWSLRFSVLSLSSLVCLVASLSGGLALAPFGLLLCLVLLVVLVFLLVLFSPVGV